jgi:hypothetical protein
MEFIFHLGSSSFLDELQKDFRKEALKGHMSSDLASIPCRVFINSCLSRLQLNGISTKSLQTTSQSSSKFKKIKNHILLLLVGVYDAIDIDNRGFIGWQDFTQVRTFDVL